MTTFEKRLLLLERTMPDGSLENTWLVSGDDGVRLHVEGAFERAVPIAVLDAVMRRYGKPLAEDIAVEEWIDAGNGGKVTLLRHRARYDVIAKDFLVYSPPGEEPMAELATSVAAALLFLLGRGESRILPTGD